MLDSGDKSSFRLGISFYEYKKTSLGKYKGSEEQIINVIFSFVRPYC